MMRICVIGDSHIAALKMGWSSIEGEFPDIAIVFFGAARPRLGDIEVKGGALIPTVNALARSFELTSGGAGRIAGDYDRYVLCGMGTSINFILPLMRGPPLESERTTGRFSGEEIDRMAQVLRASRMIEILGKLRRITEAPADLLPPPFPAPRPAFRTLNRNGRDSVFADAYARAFEQVAQPFAARYAPQPEETLKVSAITTDPAFFEGAVHMFEGTDDQLHANGRYGAVVMRSLISQAAE